MHEQIQAEEMAQETRETRHNVLAWQQRERDLERILLAASRTNPADEPGDEARP